MWMKFVLLILRQGEMTRVVMKVGEVLLYIGWLWKGLAWEWDIKGFLSNIFEFSNSLFGLSWHVLEICSRIWVWARVKEKGMHFITVLLWVKKIGREVGDDGSKGSKEKPWWVQGRWGKWRGSRKGVVVVRRVMVREVKMAGRGLGRLKEKVELVVKRVLVLAGRA